MRMIAAVVLGWVLLTATSLAAAERSEPIRARPNVLFIAVDDLNHWVGHLKRNEQAITPNIDRLAESGITFARAYCAAPACNPSRTALMSGLRPSTSGLYLNSDQPWQRFVPEGSTLGEHFRRNGYYTGGAGKIYHGTYRSTRRSEWDEYQESEGPEPPRAGKIYKAGKLDVGQLECSDADMPDYRIASWVIERLERSHERPFFLACGFHKPHLPWQVPAKYFERHPLEKIELPPTTENDLADVPPAGRRMALQSGDHEAILKSGTWKEAVQAYLASCSFADAMVGRVLEALDKSPHRGNTIVVLWGDHGWHLGEKEHWRKFALWEEATRAPLVWRVPDLTRAGSVCERPVDFMSIYPTLADLCAVPVPDHVEGKSLRPLLKDPGAAWDTPAITTHGYQNHAVRTQRWRYIRYEDGGEELYDAQKDPYEWTNLASNEEFAKVKAELAGGLPSVNKPAESREGAGRRATRPAGRGQGAQRARRGVE